MIYRELAFTLQETKRVKGQGVVNILITLIVFISLYKTLSIDWHWFICLIYSLCAAISVFSINILIQSKVAKIRTLNAVLKAKPSSKDVYILLSASSLIDISETQQAALKEYIEYLNA